LQTTALSLSALQFYWADGGLRINQNKIFVCLLRWKAKYFRKSRSSCAIELVVVPDFAVVSAL